MSLVAELFSLAGPTPTPAVSGERADAAGFAGMLDAAGARPRGLLGLGRRLAEQAQAETSRLDESGPLVGGEPLVLPGLLTVAGDKISQPLINPGPGPSAKIDEPLVNPGVPAGKPEGPLINPGVEAKTDGPLINPGVETKTDGPLINPGVATKDGQPLVNPGVPVAGDAVQPAAARPTGPAVAAEVLEVLAQTGQAVRADAAGAAVRQAVGRAPEVSAPAAPVGDTAQTDLDIDIPTPGPAVAAEGATPAGTGSGAAQTVSGSGSAQAGAADAAPARPASERAAVEPAAPEGDVSQAEVEAAPAPATSEPGQPAAVRTEAQPAHRMSADAIAQISAQIIRRLEGRATRFDVELNPHDLGKVDVRLDIDAEGRLAARLAFDNPNAAAELRGRVDDLRRDLEQAGFLMSEDAFSFADRDGARERREGLAEGSLRSFARSTEASDEADAAAQPAWRVMTRAGLDMRV